MLLHYRHGLNSKTNIKLFQQFVKRIVSPTKRYVGRIRSGFFILFLGTEFTYASVEDMAFSARFVAMANAGVAWRIGADCIFVNPAALHRTCAFDIHFFYTKPFGLKELHSGNVAARMTRGRLAAGIGAQFYGNDLYREHQFLAALAFSLSTALSIGITSRYCTVSIQHYGQTGSLLMDVGLVAGLGEKAKLGFSAKNVNNAKIGTQREPLPNVLTLGASVAPLTNCVVNFDLNKDIRFPLDVRCGVSYNTFSILALRIGAGSEPTRFCAGFSVFCFQCRIDYAFSNHCDLGLTHMFSIGVK